MARKKRQAAAAAVMEPSASASDYSPALATEAEASTPSTSADANQQEQNENENETGLIRNRFTSSLTGVQAGMNFKYKGQPHIEFADDRPPTAEEKELLDSQGENDPKFRYRGTPEKRWIGPSTPEGRDKAISVAQKIAEKRLQKDGDKNR